MRLIEGYVPNAGVLGGRRPPDMGGRLAIVSGRTSERCEPSIVGQHVMLVGKLASMPRRDVERILHEHCAVLVDRGEKQVDLIVAGDESADLTRLAADRELFDDDLRSRIANGEVELIGETMLWARLGLVESGVGVERLYTPAMLAELVGAPIAAIRQWHHRGVLRAKRNVQRLPYFDFEEVGVSRKLAQLLAAGCSLAAVNRQLDRLGRLLPGVPRPLAAPNVVVDGRCLFVRRDEGLADARGQLLIDFEGGPQLATAGDRGGPATISIMGAAALHKRAAHVPATHPYVAEDLRSLAAELDGAGRADQAVEAYRAVLFSGEATADDHFALAEMLYQAGDLSAARERYYVAIELDEDFVEARSNLGCVLAELGEIPYAEAAFRGALEYHPEYADAHYHLARLLDQVGRTAEAICHWRLFMNLAPASPWADEARERVGERG